MREYHAGPMTGYRNYNWEAFRALAKVRRAAGHDVVSPTEIDEVGGFVKVVESPQGKVLDVIISEDFDYEEVLARDLEALETCETIVLLNGWNGSPGAKRELQRALDLGLLVLTEWEARTYA